MHSAREAAEAFERIEAADRLRSLRMQRHLVTGGLAAVALVAVAGRVETLQAFVVFWFLFAVVIRSAARGMEARFGHRWGQTYSRPPVPTRLDLLTQRTIDALRPPPRDVAIAESPVRTLSPLPPESQQSRGLLRR